MTKSRKGIREMREYYSLEISHLSGKIRPYIRTSSKGIGQSDKRQFKAFQDFKNQFPNFEYDIVYNEVGSAKGGSVRKKFNDMLADGKANKFEIVWIDSPTRFAKDLLTGLQAMEKLIDAGIRVYIRRLNKILNPFDIGDRMMFQMMLFMAETANLENKEQSEDGTDTKISNLDIWQKYEGLCGVRMNNPTAFDMIVADPFWSEVETMKEIAGKMFRLEARPQKKGVCNVKIPHMEEHFQLDVMVGMPYRKLADRYLRPVNPKCGYGCYNGKELPFGGMPRCDGKKYLGTKKTKSSEVTEFLENGGWKSYIKSDEEINQDAFKWGNGIRPTRKCGCGQKTTETTICKWRKELVYENPEIDCDRPRPEAFKRLDAVGTEVPIEELSALYAGGLVRST
jgi:hypothetical protein